MCTHESTGSSVMLSRIVLCENFKLSYELLKTRVDGDTDEPGDPEVYSILIVKLNSDNDYECDFVYDVTRNYDTAKQYLNILSRETVTPVSLRDVLYDLL